VFFELVWLLNRPKLRPTLGKNPSLRGVSRGWDTVKAECLSHDIYQHSLPVYESTGLYEENLWKKPQPWQGFEPRTSRIWTGRACHASTVLGLHHMDFLNYYVFPCLNTKNMTDKSYHVTSDISKIWHLKEIFRKKWTGKNWL
jgi:hypothetical protein